ncbi:hypothetical protein BU23DRAFT_524667 [Bimuria novae-zelandiae CBS 107.79]|uniref:Zn(2)-C6 fungal-type domain-containing protein n=1 Tax=Bimuria novae-zelandiae CBS 107.79 TaxID=1447943 RepID=A0A6A5VQB9_9PLEO|nr:hypothetical protein BU23DRAFT_524667 [Bimuria novae-zelandiae CBS 107.79]
MTGNIFPARFQAGHRDRTLNTNYRRNGKLQSCEPCRKGKLRCDHMTPTCGRCARRNKANQCVYHPAPLTKRAIVPTPTSESETTSPPDTVQPLLQSVEGFLPAPVVTPLTATSLRVGVPPSQPAPVVSSQATGPRARRHSLPAQPSALTYEEQSIEELRRPLPVAHVRGDSILRLPAAGFVHHTAILDEYERSIGIQQSNAEGPTDSTSVSSLYIERGAAVLTLLKEPAIFQRYLDKWFSFGRGIILVEPMIQIWTSGLWATWGKTLREQNLKELRRMSEKIWQNTLKPVSRLLNRHTKPREFCAAVTGENLRWEVVGIVLTLVALLCDSLSDVDPIFCSKDAPLEDRATLILRTHNASEICIGFCEDFAIVNDLYLWFLYENTTLYCSLRTRGSFENWKRSGILATAMIFFNLHQEIKVDDNTPFFIAELRKRLFVCAYVNDKYSAIYNGRPPRLTRQYCMLQCPLDLNDEQLMSEGPELELAMQSLDEEGWNLEARVQRSTFARLFMHNSLLAEEILEISLGTSPHEEIIGRAADIERRAIELHASLPEFLRVDDRPFQELKRPPIELLYMAYIRLDTLNHHFLLQRTLVKKIGADSSKLLAIAQEMFSFAVLLINNLSILRDFQIDIIQMLTMDGIPSASIIAVELLHQVQNPTSASALANPLPRSTTIQELSVFVACLDSVHCKPAHTSHSVSRGRKFLRKILDTILEPPPMRSTTDDTSAPNMGDPSLTSPLPPLGNDGDFMRWLDSMDFECESWVNMT